MKRSSKYLVLASERENANSFRMRNSGIDLRDSTANSLLLRMHHLPTRNSKEEILPLDYWGDVHIEEDGKLYEVPKRMCYSGIVLLRLRQATSV